MNENFYAWYDKHGTGRDLRGYFRKSFIVNGGVLKAKFQIFADTVYQLWVNGSFAGFGPVRFNPEFPQYDTYDIAPLLTEGENVIAVKVQYFGMKTYKAVPNRAVLYTAGEVVSADGQTEDLSAAGFKCIKAPVYKSGMPKMSFALPPADVYYADNEKDGWMKKGYDDSQWQDAVIPEDLSVWGEFTPREIPFMRLTPIDVSACVKIFPLRNDFETVYSFEVPNPDLYEDNNNKSAFIAFKTWVWSPKKQSAVVGGFWGESWLNGREIPEGVTEEGRSMRINQVWEFEEGWNFYMGKVKAYSDYLHEMFAVPKNAGLIFSADKNPDSGRRFAHTPILTNTDYDNFLKEKPLPYQPDDTLSELCSCEGYADYPADKISGGWIYTDETDVVVNPVKWSAWDNYGAIFEQVKYESLQGKVFTKELYPEGFSILIDVDHTKLLLPEYSFSGTENAIIDTSVAEHLTKDNKHPSMEFQYLGGDRVYCGGKASVSFMPMNPRGFRYMMITVRNTSGDVTLDEIILRDAAYPAEQAGSFECSDKKLNAIWNLCKTTQSVNMEDVYVDCVGRERGMYTRDTVIQYYNNLVIYGDHKLFKRCMELYGQSADRTGRYRGVYPNDGTYVIPEFCFNAMEGHMVYYQNTGDIEHLRRYWPDMVKNMEWFNKVSDKREDKLINTLDIYIDKADRMKDELACSFNSMYLYSLNIAATVAGIVDDKIRAVEYEKRAAVLKKSLTEMFFVQEKGTFSDVLGGDKFSTATALNAIRCGAYKPSQLPGIRAFIRKNLKSIFLDGYSPVNGTHFSPANAFYMFDALYKLDLTDVAETLIRDGWGWFITTGLPTTPEYYELDHSLSWCHAWSASPVYYLSKHLSGINFIDSPKMSQVEIKVDAYDVEWAKIKYPHPGGGVIEVEWHMEDGKRIFDKLELPEGVSLTGEAR